MITELVDVSADMTVKDRIGRSVLHLAAEHGHADAINVLVTAMMAQKLDLHAQVSAGPCTGQPCRARPVLARLPGCPGAQCLLPVSWAGHNRPDNRLLVQDREGRTAVQLAAEAGHVKVCVLLPTHDAWSAG